MKMAANRTTLKSSLDSFWKSNFTSHSETGEKIFHSMKSFLDPILVKLQGRDPVLEFDPLDFSKFYQGKTSDVFELLVCLKKFDSSEVGLNIEDGKSPTGFAVAKLTEKRTIWDNFCIRNNSGKKYVSSRIFAENLLEHVKRLMPENPATASARSNTCKIEIRDHVKDNVLTFSLIYSSHEVYIVRVIHSIPCRNRWIFGAKVWQAEESHWPTKAMKQECAQKGFYLVGRQALTKSPCQWQIAFLDQMRKFLDEDNGCRNKCLLFLKLILNNSRELQRGVTQFHLETIILNLYKKYPKASFWTEDKFMQRFLDAVHDLQESIEERNLQDFILFDLNLMKEIHKPTAESCRKQLKMLVEEPEKFFDSLAAQQNTSL